jgi:phage nucleotide-binding protein
MVVSSSDVLERSETWSGMRRKTARDVADQGFFLMLYGPGGAGKTRTAGKLARYAPMAAHLDAEGGASSLADLVEEGKVDSYDAVSWKNLEDTRKQMERDPGSYRTIILDNMSEIQAVAMRSITTAAKPEIQQYLICTAYMLEMIRGWREIARKHGINVIMTAWDETEKDELDGMIKKRVQFTPSLASKVPGLITMVGHLTVPSATSTTRMLSFAPSTRTDAKFRIAPNGPAKDIPLQLWFGDDANPLADMLATVREGKKFPADRYKKPSSGS